jgi:hypothetical protein
VASTTTGANAGTERSNDEPVATPLPREDFDCRPGLRLFSIARELYRNVKAEDCPPLIERLLKAYLAHREASETFLAFTRRHEVAALKAMVDHVTREAA